MLAQLMDRLHGGFAPLTRSATFRAFSYVLLLNPIALFLQLEKMLRTGDVAGVSLSMMMIFIVIQIISAIIAIEARSASMFIANALSVVVTAAIILAVILS